MLKNRTEKYRNKYSEYYYTCYDTWLIYCTTHFGNIFFSFSFVRLFLFYIFIVVCFLTVNKVVYRPIMVGVCLLELDSTIVLTSHEMSHCMMFDIFCVFNLFMYEVSNTMTVQ